MAITRVSPGRYTDGKKTINAKSAAEAAKLFASGTTGTTGTSPAQGFVPGMNPQQQSAAAASLRDQVAKGWITQAQADAQMALNAQGQQFDPATKFDTPGNFLNSAYDVNQKQVVQGNVLTNPNQVGPFANQNVTYDPITGQPTVNTSLSQGNQQVVGGVQSGAVNANNVFNQLLNSGIYGQIMGGPQGTQNSAFTDAVFGQLTQGVDQRKAKDLEQLQQTLANRGIPLDSQLYNNQVSQLNKQYDDVYQNAQYQAVQQGNQLGQQAIGQLAGIGKSGYFDQNLQPFQSQQYQGVDPNNLYNTQTGAQLSKEEMANKLQIARLGYGGRGSGGGGGGQPANPYPNPILNTVPGA